MITNINSDFAVQHAQESDDQLLSEAKSGDQQAFAELCLRYRGMLLHRIYRIVRHREDAEDVLQDTLLSAYQHLDSFRGACRFSSWVIKIGINRSLMFLRKCRSLAETTPDVFMDDGQSVETREFRYPGPNPEQCYLMRQNRQKLTHAISRLSPQLRSLWELYYKEELRLKDAANVMGISEATAKSRILRARGKLRRSLKKNEFWTP